MQTLYPTMTENSHANSFWKHLLQTASLAWPVVLSQLSHTLVGLIDNLYISRLGAEQLASGALVISVSVILLVFEVGFSAGVTSLIAQARGADEHQEIKTLFKNSLVTNLALGTFITLLGMGVVFTLPFLRQPPEVVAFAKEFLPLICLSLFPLMVYQIFKQFAEGMGDTRAAMYMGMVQVVVNLGLLELLVLGHFGFPRLEMVGAGFATLGARIAMATGMAVYVLTHPKFKRYLPDLNFKGVSTAYFKKLSGMGLPIALQYTFEAGVFGGAAILAGMFGAKAMAAHHIVLNLAACTFMVAVGLSAATSVRVGYALGEKSVANIWKATMAALFLIIVYECFCIALFVLGADFLPTAFSADPEVLKLTAALMLVAAAFQLVDGLQVVAMGALRGIQDVKIPTAITLVAYWFVAMPCCYFFGFWAGFQVEGIWYGLSAGLLVAAALLIGRIFSAFNKLPELLASGKLQTDTTNQAPTLH